MAATATGHTEPAETFLAQVIGSPYAWFALKVVVGLLLLIVGFRLGRWVAEIERRVLLRAHVDAILAEFLRNATHIFVFAVILVSALELTGFPTTSLLTALGAAGLAVGLALKDSLSHIAAGVVLIVLRPFRVGDAVNIAGQDGVVEGIHIFQTRLHTFDNRDLVFMNGAVIAAPIFNYSQRASRRADFSLTLPHDADLRRVFSIVRETIGADERILRDPAPYVAVGDILDRGVILVVQVWSAAGAMGAVRGDLLLALQQRLRDQGVEFVRSYAAPAPRMPPAETQPRPGSAGERGGGRV